MMSQNLATKSVVNLDVSKISFCGTVAFGLWGFRGLECGFMGDRLGQ